jgi:hypothetical protein
MVNWFLDGSAQWVIAEFLTSALQWIWSLLSQAAFITPDVTGFPQVTAISGRSLIIANTCYLMLITVAGIIIMTRDSIQARYGVAELAPRLVIGLIAANLATPICANLIGLSNALITALTGEGIAGTGSVDQMDRIVTAAMRNPANTMLTAVIGVIILGLAGALLVTWLVRLTTLVVLVGVAPAALGCHGLPQLEGVAKLWWRAILATLGTVVLQALALHAALSVFLSPAANLPALGLPHDPTGTFNLFIVACLLGAVVKIPGLMRRYVTGRGGTSLGSSLIRVVVVQQLTRVLTRSLLGRSPRAAARAGAGRTTAGRAGGAAAGGAPRPPRPTHPASSSSGGPTPAHTPVPAGPKPPPSAVIPPPVASTPSPARTRPTMASHVTPATVMPQRMPRWRRSWAYQPSGTGWPQPPAPATPPPRPRPARPSGTGWPAVSPTPPRRTPPAR